MASSLAPRTTASFGAGPRERARFDREVQILAALNHPNIAQIHARVRRRSGFR